MNEKPLVKNIPKLFQVLQKLPPSQLTKLRKLIDSPYFHQTEGVKQLFHYLRKHHPRYPLQKVTDETIAQQLFPDFENGAKKVKNFKTDLMKLIEQFLIFQQFSQQADQQQFYLAQAYQDLQLFDYADNGIKKLRRSMAQASVQGLSDLYLKIQLSHFQYYHPDRPEAIKNQQTLQELLNQLDHYFISAKYKYTYEALERMSKRKEQFDFRFWEEVQAEVPNFGGNEKHSPIYYYRKLQQLATRNGFDTVSFEKLKNDFFKNLDFLYPEDGLAIFRYLLNGVATSLNKGNAQLAPLQFALYQEGLSHDLILWKNRIPMNTFLNIVVIASTCKAIDWLDDFIDDYQVYIHPALQEDVVKTAFALAAFYQGDVEKAYSKLRNIQLKNKKLELFCLLLEIKILFEFFLADQTFQSVMNSRLDSLEKKVFKRYDFAASKKKEYLNFVHFTQGLVKSINNVKNNTLTIKRIRTQLTSTKHLIHKVWLQQKCDQILKETRHQSK